MGATTAALLDVACSEYGQDWSGWGGPRRASRWQSRLFRPIRSAGGYVAAVRGVAGSWLCDGRLIAPAWNRLSPTVLIERLEEWLDYWRVTQARFDRVGSPYNDQPEEVFGLWLWGVPAGMYPRGFGWLLPTGRGRGGRKRLRALWRISRAFWAGSHLVGSLVVPGVSTRDLVRLSRLRPTALRYLASREYRRLAAQDVQSIWAGTRLDIQVLALALCEWRSYLDLRGWELIKSQFRYGSQFRFSLWAGIVAGTDGSVEQARAAVVGWMLSEGEVA